VQQDDDEDSGVASVVEHVHTTSTTIVDGPSPTPTTTCRDHEEAPAEGEVASRRSSLTSTSGSLLTVYFGTPNMFITLWFGFDYGTNPPLGTLII
jgi:hypothetical protein